MEKPYISVVMANRNTNEDYLKSSIESILNQTYKNFEFIIIDDGSTGNDLEVIRSYSDERIRLIENGEQRGISFSANRGFKQARGKYIARMDSDDISLPRRLEKQAAYLEKHPEIDVLSARALNFGDISGVRASMIKDPAIMKAAFFFGFPLTNPTVMIRKSFLEKYDLLYNEDYRNAEDYEFFSRCIFLGKVTEYPDVLLKYRRHIKQITILDKATQTGNANKVRDSFLKKAGIEPDERQSDIHYSLCTGELNPSIGLKDISDWAETLMNANTAAYNEGAFKRAIVVRYIVLASKYLIKRRIQCSKLLKLPMTKKALNPKYYGSYFGQLRYTAIAHSGRAKVKTRHA